MIMRTLLLIRSDDFLRRARSAQTTNGQKDEIRERTIIIECEFYLILGTGVILTGCAFKSILFYSRAPRTILIRTLNSSLMRTNLLDPCHGCVFLVQILCVSPQILFLDYRKPLLPTVVIKSFIAFAERIM